MTNEEAQAWLDAFFMEHGFYPNEDPNLLNKGFSPDQAMGEHLYALQWATEQNRPPAQQDYSREYRRRYEPWSLRDAYAKPETPYKMTSSGRRMATPKRMYRYLADYMSDTYNPYRYGR